MLISSFLKLIETYNWSSYVLIGRDGVFSLNSDRILNEPLFKGSTIDTSFRFVV